MIDAREDVSAPAPQSRQPPRHKSFQRRVP